MRATAAGLRPTLQLPGGLLIDYSMSSKPPHVHGDKTGLMTEASLVAGLRRGDEACFELVVRRYGPRMFSVARRLVRDEADAADCVQDALVQALRRIDTFEERAALGTWLHRIVVNAALMRNRTQARRNEMPIGDISQDFDENGMRHETADPTLIPIDTLLETREVRRFVRQAIYSLPSSYRNVLILRDIEGYNTEEAAKLLGVSPGAIRIRLHRARSALKKLLDPIMSGMEPSP